MTSPQRWICLDVGETLIDETRIWETWAHVLGVTPLTFMATLGVVLARGGDHREAFELVGVMDWRDRAAEFVARFGGFQETDLYPDALPAIQQLRDEGYRVAIIANQPRERTRELQALGVEVDVMAMSDELGVHKPSPDFYARALELMEASAADVAYVGDRIDNDVLPSAAAGMHPVWIRRGPWALLAPGVPPPGTLTVDSLLEVVERIGEIWPAAVAR